MEHLLDEGMEGSLEMEEDDDGDDCLAWCFSHLSDLAFDILVRKYL